MLYQQDSFQCIWGMGYGEPQFTRVGPCVVIPVPVLNGARRVFRAQWYFKVGPGFQGVLLCPIWRRSAHQNERGMFSFGV